jgi:hypothetical protein
MSFLNKKIQQFIDKKDIAISKNKLSNTSWLKTNTGNNKITYSFLTDNELIISNDGEGIRARWEFLVDNDTLIIEKECIEVFNCQIIYDEFLILNKDNTDSIEIYGNLSKFKSNQVKEIQSKFDLLFQKLSVSNDIDPLEKLYYLKIYEIMILLETGTEKNRLKRLFNDVVYDHASGVVFFKSFNSITNKNLSQSLNQSKFKRSDILNIVENLIVYKIITS